MMSGIVKARRRRDCAISPIMKRGKNNKWGGKIKMGWMKNKKSGCATSQERERNKSGVERKTGEASDLMTRKKQRKETKSERQAGGNKPCGIRKAIGRAAHQAGIKATRQEAMVVSSHNVWLQRPDGKD